MERTKQLVTSFADYTTIHGIGRISRVKYFVHKLFWVLVFCGSLTMLSIQVYRLGQQYSSHNVNTKITVKYGKQPFPGVTICNLNPVKFSAVMQNRELYHTLDSLSYHTSVPLSEFSTVDTIELPDFNFTEAIVLGNKPLRNGRKQFLIDVLELGRDELDKMSESFEELVVHCTFHGEPCNRSDFTRKRTDDYGFCYELITGDFKSSVAGPYNGLEMVLNIKQNEYVPFLTQSAGIKVVIQDNDYYPNLQHNTISVPAGFEINVGLSMTITKRYEGVDKRCDPENLHLSVTACIQACRAQTISDICGCEMSWENRESTETHVCYTTEDMECVDLADATIDNSEYCAHCKPPCRELKYEPHVSMTKWPAANYEPYLRKLIEDSILDFKKARDDMLLIRVFFESLEYMLVEEEAAYTEENFVSDIGGQLGLWCGLSVLSCVEVIELLCFLCTAACHAKCKKRKRDGNDDNNGSVEERKDLMKNKENLSDKNIPNESMA